MGQHKNSIQIEIFIKFMEKHPDLARGFVKGDRVHVEQLWTELANELNASGPPNKEVAGWKRLVWTDMKLNVKQHLAHNKVEVTKTGGGRFNKYILSPSDEQVAVICGFYASVDGIENAKRYGVPKKVVPPKKNYEVPTTSTSTENDNNDNVPSTSRSAPTPKSPSHEAIIVMSPSQFRSTGEGPSSRSSTPTTSAQVSSRKRKRQVADVGDVMEMEAEHFSKISANLKKIKDEIKENRRILKELSRNVRELKVLKQHELKERTRHHYVLERSMQTKNELKLQFLELERMKLGIQAAPSNE